MRYLLSLLLLGAYLGLLWPMSRSSSAALSVTVVERDGRVRARARSQKPVELSVDGQPRRSASLSGPVQLPGLHRALWRVRYLGQPARQVAYGYLGPDRLPADWIPRAARLSVAQRLLDRGPDSLAAALGPLLGRAVRRQLEGLSWPARLVVPMLLGRLQPVRVALRIRSGGIEVGARVSFADGEHELRVEAGSTVQLALRDRRLVLRRQPVRVRVVAAEGGSWLTRLRGTVGRLLLDHTLPAQVERAFDRVLPRVERALDGLLHHSATIELVEPAIRLAWRPSSLLLEPGRAVHVRFDLALHARSAASGRAVRRSGGPVAGPPLARRSDVEQLSVALSANALASALHLLWRRGALDREVSSLVTAERLLDRRVAELLAYRVASARLLVVPAVTRWTRRGIDIGLTRARLRLEPNVEKGRSRTSQQRRVELSTSLELRGSIARCRLRLELRARQPLIASCVDTAAPLARSAAAVRLARSPLRLRPCFSELAGLASRWLRARGALPLTVGLGPTCRPRSLSAADGTLSLRPTPRRLRLDATERSLIVSGSVRFSFR